MENKLKLFNAIIDSELNLIVQRTNIMNLKLKKHGGYGTGLLFDYGHFVF